MTDLLAIAVWPLAMGVSALLFSMVMFWLITKDHRTKSAD